MNIKHYIATAFLSLSIAAHAQQTPAGPQKESVLIMNATAHIGNGKVIENSLIGFKDGKLTLVADATTTRIDPSSYDQVISADGKHVYPGFIAVNSSLGLAEIDAVKATVDDAEIGGIIPHIRSIIAYNAESKVVESMRPNGVLLAQVAPRGGRISGTSSVVQLDAWNWEDAAIKADDAIHMTWPNGFTRGRWWLGEDAGLKPNPEYSKQIDEVKSFITQAKAYLNGKQTPRHLPFESMNGLFDGSKKLFVNVDGEKEMTDVILFAKSVGIPQLIIIGGDEADRIIPLLKQHNVAVVVSRPHRLPSTEDSDVKHPFRLASILANEGVLTGIDPSGDMERMSTRNLPFYAGTVAAYGLNKEAAVQLITLNAAKILGIEDFAGTLEAGKDATLFIANGDALDMRTNILTKAYIQGRDISLDSHQTNLYERYNTKINGKK